LPEPPSSWTGPDAGVRSDHFHQQFVLSYPATA
jgi:hypothetical protein